MNQTHERTSGNYTAVVEDIDVLRSLSPKEIFEKLHTNTQSLGRICFQVLEAKLPEQVIFYAIAYFVAKAKGENKIYDAAVQKFKEQYLPGRLTTIYYIAQDGKKERELFMNTVKYLLREGEYIDNIHSEDQKKEILENLGEAENIFTHYKFLLTTNTSKEELVGALS